MEVTTHYMNCTVSENIIKMHPVISISKNEPRIRFNVEFDILTHIIGDNDPIAHVTKKNISREVWYFHELYTKYIVI